MKTRSRLPGKRNDEMVTSRGDKFGQFKLTCRSALVLLLAQNITLVDAALLCAAHVPPPLVAVSMVTAFISSRRFFDGLIE